MGQFDFVLFCFVQLQTASCNSDGAHKCFMTHRQESERMTKEEKRNKYIVKKLLAFMNEVRTKVSKKRNKIFQQLTHTANINMLANNSDMNFEADTWIRSINRNWPQICTAPHCYWLLFFNQLYEREWTYVHKRKKWVEWKQTLTSGWKVPGRKCVLASREYWDQTMF